APAAVKTFHARRGVCRHHPLSNPEVFNLIAHRDDIAGEFVAKESRRHDHASVISTLEDFDVGAAGKRSPHAHQHVSRTNIGYWYRLDLQPLLPIKYSGHHLVVHYDHLCG